MLKNILDKKEDFQKYLYIRGFIITNKDLDCENEYPFYGNWSMTKVGSFNVWVNNLQKLFYLEKEGRSFFLIGHAYNPFTMDHDESIILEKIAQAYMLGEKEYYKVINELTGLFILGFIEGNDITFLLDCSGMLYGCYGYIDGKIYIASHMQLIGDLCNLEMDEYVKKLISYKWYKYMLGNYLPGDLTAFSEVKRIIPNTCVSFKENKFSINRFFPNEELLMCKNKEDYESTIKQVAQIMNNSMNLITQKWKNPAISLTGGVDSNTTFAAANGIYDRFKTFSYISMYRESVDADAAKKISKAFNVKHTIYEIPDVNEKIKDYDIYFLILTQNQGDIGYTRDNEIRKRITLQQNHDFDVEVKSWISETVRAYAYKYFGTKNLPKVMKPRHYTSMYKIFLFNRKLVKETDKKFKEYIIKTKLKEKLENYDESDMFVWEMMHGGKCGLDISQMLFCFDITIPYNNRELLKMLLAVDLDSRYKDNHHYDLKRYLNPELADMNITIKNLNETKSRSRVLNTYFKINSLLPY